jgi:hypothetical protein
VRMLHSLTPEPVPESDAVPRRGGTERRSFAENTGMSFHRRGAESLRKTQRKKRGWRFGQGGGVHLLYRSERGCGSVDLRGGVVLESQRRKCDDVEH